ncbi:MAG TPA: hypothetical protein VIN59_00680, partial [Alphaproteobacteria bacterium]
QSAFNDPGTVMTNPDGSTPGGLIAVEPKVEAGNIDPGTNNSVIVQFRNDSGAEIEFRDVKLFPSSNITAQVISDQCSGGDDDSAALAAGAQCAVVMEVKGLQSGAFRVEVLARHSGRSRLVTATVSGTVETSEDNTVKATDLEITPSPVDFGKLEASRPIIRSVTIRNITSKRIVIADMATEAPIASGFDLKSDCKELVAGASCIASIVWSPVTKGPTSGALVVPYTVFNDSETPELQSVATATLTGDFSPAQSEVAKAFPEAVPGKGLLVASEEEIDFGAGINSQSSITVSLVNIGDASLTISDVELAGSEQGLKIMPSGCTKELVLEPTEACPLTVSWSPSKSGAVIDDVRITHTGARGVMVLPVRGTSTATVNVDAKPIVQTIVEDGTITSGPTPTGEFVVPSPSSVSVQPSYQEFIPPEDAGPPTLDGYTISSLSTRNAIINGPGGSRMVRQGQMVRLSGHIWRVSVTPDGVGLTSGRSKVLLVFDRSLAAPSGVTVDSSSTSTPSNSASSTSTTTTDTSTTQSGTTVDSGTTTGAP